MELRNGDIFATKPVLEAVLKLPADKLTWKGKYYLAKLGRVLSAPLADIEATRVKLVQQYGEKTETGFQVPAGEKVIAFQAALAEVLDLEVEVDWKCITLTDKDAEALTGEEMMLLDRFIAFPEPKEPQGATGDGVVKEAEAVLNKK